MQKKVMTREAPHQRGNGKVVEKQSCPWPWPSSHSEPRYSYYRLITPLALTPAPTLIIWKFTTIKRTWEHHKKHIEVSSWITIQERF